MKKRIRDIVVLSFIGMAVVASVLLSFLSPTYSSEGYVQTLVSETVLRSILLLPILLLFFLYGYYKKYRLATKDAWTKLYWALPCLLCVLANFPFSALIQGKATIDHPNYLWLFTLYCLFVSVLEEILFRVVLLDFLMGWLKEKRHGAALSIFLSSAIFGLYHLANLFAGAAVGPTLLQVGYSFLIGGMFAIALYRTKNILVPILLHFVFDFGGFLVSTLGQGTFQDLVFWILTAAMGALTLGHCLIALWNIDREEEAKKDSPKPE